jgi:hypothetical protein
MYIIKGDNNFRLKPRGADFGAVFIFGVQNPHGFLIEKKTKVLVFFLKIGFGLE